MNSIRPLTMLFLLFFFSCQYYNGKLRVPAQAEDSTEIIQAKVELPAVQEKANYANTANTKPEQLLAFAKSLIGTPYRYGSSDPAIGFDCSGFITYVFNHFNMAVPRSSIEFTHYKTEVDLKDAKEGDLILFTGTDTAVREVGHMGIITSISNGHVQFIHSSSGKANGVTITPLNTYYKGRFVKVIRVL